MGFLIILPVSNYEKHYDLHIQPWCNLSRREGILCPRAIAFTEHENLRSRIRKTDCFTMYSFLDTVFEVWVISTPKARIIWADPN